MINLEDEVDRVIRDLVAQLVELARNAVFNTLDTAFVRFTGDRARCGDFGLHAGQFNPRRGTAELVSLSERLMEYVRANPGHHIGQISRQLGTTSQKLRYPIQRLVGNGALLTKGKTRRTTYYAQDAVNPELTPSLLDLTHGTVKCVNELAASDDREIDSE